MTGEFGNAKRISKDAVAGASAKTASDTSMLGRGAASGFLGTPAALRAPARSRVARTSCASR